MNLRTMDYEEGGERGKHLLKGSIARSFLDAGFRFEAVRTYTEPLRPMRSH